jgi:hypothetical protein
MPQTSRLPSWLKAIVLGTTLSLTMATASFAQSYDPDIGSGNIARGHSGARYFGRIHPAWRAMVVPHGARHVRHRHHG